ncbi:putative bifunctional diguanylate cyclase/phosphodiesterase [Egicoccus sp. AB-alg6-2]|uniref:putative bifunctional diguanylate cyclase/phosphodiesterase n=1 Tax=Egicoccus sp. AB-alg6-2 TaxID=3242692 RepID=UPI00359CE80B
MGSGSQTDVARPHALPWARSAPSDVRWRLESLGMLWIAGGILGLLVLALAARRDMAVGVLALIGSSAIAVGVLLIAVGRRQPRAAVPTRWTCHLPLVVGTVAIGGCVAAAGGGSAPIAYGALFVWIGLYAGAFFTPRAVAAHVAFSMVAFGVALRSLGQPMAAEMLLVGGVTTAAAVLSVWTAWQRSLANSDPLTGVMNLRGFERALEQQIERCERSRTPLALALVDLDGFKGYNDQHGSVAGDRLLATTAGRWQAQLPDTALMARLGGDEFAFMLPGMTPDAAGELVDQLRALLPAPVTGSAGVTEWCPGDTPSQLRARTDGALFQAKRSGRDRTQVTDHELTSALELWRALEAGEFVLHYQPIHSLADGGLDGYEALIRWEHPEKGMQSPAEFITAAERSGAIHAIGRWVIDEACRYAAALRERHGDQAPTVSVNVSTLQLTDPRLASDIRYALAATRLPPQALVLELTESALDGSVTDAADALCRLRELGVQLAIDDFGTGYSSLHRLRNLPFDILKIDRSFVADIGDERHDALLCAIIAMANSLGLDTVAEGIETETQRHFLAANGCVRGQGYLLGRPAPSTLGVSDR